MRSKSVTLGTETDAAEISVPEAPWSKLKLLKNLAVVCTGVFLYLSAQLPASELQSSLNFADGLGTFSQSIGAAINIIPCVLLPPYCTRRFGLKRCMVVAILLGSLSYFGNFYPKPWTLIPAAILQNMGTSPMWTAKGTYITHIAEQFAVLTKMPQQVITNLFFGIFYSSYYSGYVFGNLLPFYLLKRPNQVINDTSKCGFEFCDAVSSQNNSNFDRPPESQVDLLFGIFFLITVAGALVIQVLLDPLTLAHTTEATWTRALDSIFILKKWDQWCMCFISLYRGVNRALLTADFTKGYITCTWGMNHIGYILISFGVGCGMCSITLGYLVRWLGRPVLFLTAVASNLAIMLAMIFWEPNPDQPYVFFALVIVWGASNAVWESQVAALNPVLYPDRRDAAYTNYANAETVGTAVAQGISSVLCMDIKIYANLALLGVAAASYTALEVGPLRRADREAANLQTERTHADHATGTNGVAHLNERVGLSRKLTAHNRQYTSETAMERF